MEETQSLFEFMSQQSGKLFSQTVEHIGLTFISLFIAVMIGVPAGIAIRNRKRLASVVLAFTGILQTIPSIALLGFLIPIAGIGAKPAIFALLLYALLPIVRNTYTGITGVNPVVTEAARAMGMTDFQILTKVQLPLAMPVIFAGIRTATVINVGVATLAAYIAAGGLGEFIFGGIALNNTNMILAGAIPAALLAIIFDFLLARLQNMKFSRSKFTTWLLPLALAILSSFYLIPSALEGDFLAGFTPEFMGRTDGNLGLRSKYGLRVRTVVISDAVMYQAIHKGELDVISGYSTDGRLKAYDLVTLEDDKKIFPPYYVAPVIRNNVLKAHPELEETLNLLSGLINDSIMTLLNYKADYLKQSPEKVARDFLVTKGLWKEPRGGKKAVIRIGSKIFTEQYILANMYTMLIKGYTDLDVSTRTGLGGTKICFDALTNDQIDFYPEYTGTALLVLLHPTKQQLAGLESDKDKVYRFVSSEFTRQYDLSWLKPVGFNNAYALMMKSRKADSLNIHSISDMKAFLENVKADESKR